MSTKADQAHEASGLFTNQKRIRVRVVNDALRAESEPVLREIADV